MTYGREGHSGKLPKGQPSNSCFKSNKNKKFGLLKNCIFLLMLTIDMSIDKKTILLKAKSLRGFTLCFTIIQELLGKLNRRFDRGLIFQAMSWKTKNGEARKLPTILK
ncbi:TPA: hypothetical protein AABU97_000137 [Neisseria gonorrhoeae]